MVRGDGCCLLNTTSALVAQGTLAGLVLAGLVWFGTGMVGLLLLYLLLLLLLGILGGLCTAFFGLAPSSTACCEACITVCDACGNACASCGAPCGECCGGTCCGGCGECGDCGDCGDCGGCGGCGDCGTCDCGGGAAGGGTGGCGCTTLATGIGPHVLAHHPDLPAFAEDVYTVRGVRLCVGCFTTYPLFLTLATVLFLAQPSLAWSVAVGAGAGLAALQAISAAGWARRRHVKVLVKTALGLGLALFVYGALVSPLHPIGQFFLLAGALALSRLSALPRARRIRAQTPERPTCARCAATAVPAASSPRTPSN